MFFILLCLSVPPNPPPTVANFKTVELADLDQKAIEHLTHSPETFHVVLTSAADNCGSWRCYELQMKPGLFATVWFMPAEDDDVTADEPEEQVIRGRVYVIWQWDMKGRPFTEYRIYGERIVAMK